ncbi:uncharacterized protein LOC141853815 [Brevipalpus obovatus]|uniref:uncharacterized protein LOC141853815 n=1 Tax=Brevipalpus obovatus TaxID=246614 RepID=UPI003D9F2AED
MMSSTGGEEKENSISRAARVSVSVNADPSELLHPYLALHISGRSRKIQEETTYVDWSVPDPPPRRRIAAVFDPKSVVKSESVENGDTKKMDSKATSSTSSSSTMGQTAGSSGDGSNMKPKAVFPPVLQRGKFALNGEIRPPLDDNERLWVPSRWGRLNKSNPTIWDLPYYNMWEMHNEPYKNKSGPIFNDEYKKKYREIAELFDEDYVPDPTKPRITYAQRFIAMKERWAREEEEKRRSQGLIVKQDETPKENSHYLQKFMKNNRSFIKFRISESQIVYLSPNFINKIQKIFPQSLLSKAFQKETMDRFKASLPQDADGCYYIRADIKKDHWGVILNYLDTKILKYFRMPKYELFELAYALDFLNIELNEGAHRFVSDLIYHYLTAKRNSDKERILTIFRALPPIYALNEYIREIQDTGKCTNFDRKFNIGQDICNKWVRLKHQKERIALSRTR